MTQAALTQPQLQDQDKPKRTVANPWLVLMFIALPVFIGSLDLTVVSAFLPELIVELQLPPQTATDDASWVVGGYLLAYTVSLTFAGRLSDLVGRRAVYVACLIVFVFGSYLVAVAGGWPTDVLNGAFRRFGQRPDPTVMNLLAIIIGRIVQALGAGAMVPVSLALVGDLFPPERRALPLGAIGAMDTLGWVLGHLYGGLLVQVMPWEGIFWLNVPLSLIALVLVLWSLRGLPQLRGKGTFDWLGTLLIVGAIIALNLGLGANIETGNVTSFEDASGFSAATPYWLAGAGVLFVLFIAWELYTRSPLVNLRLFRRRNFGMGSLTNLFVGFCLMIGLVTVPILVNIRQVDTSTLQAAALQVGLLLSALTVPMALAAVPGGLLSSRVGYRVTTVVGLLIAAVGFVIIWRTWSLDISDFNVVWQMAIVGVGLGLTFSPISAAVINAAGEAEHGVASALVLVLRLLGMTLSVSILSSLAIARVNGLVAAALGVDSSNLLTDAAGYVTTYAQSAVQVLGELGLVGAVLCAVALVPALLLQGRGEAAA